VVGCFLLDVDSNRSNAICRWHIAATSSQTGGFFDFYPQKWVKMLSNPSSVTTSESWGFFFHSPLLKFGFFQILKGGFSVSLWFSLTSLQTGWKPAFCWHFRFSSVPWHDRKYPG
jgi:hypothetical protein